MSREINFRVFDKIENRMYHAFDFPDKYLMSLDGNIWDTSMKSTDGLGEIINGRFIVMQSTGIKDIEGSFIYESDIVQRGIIIFDNGKFQGCYYSDGGDLAETWEDDLYRERNLKVLGNIHQHPHLLK